MAERRRMGIEAALSWAYRDELPKTWETLGISVPGFGAAWGGIERYGELMTLVEAQDNRWGVVPDFTAQRGPHPDARRIGEAVLALDETRCFALPEGWDPLGDFTGLGERGEGLKGAAVARALRELLRPGEATLRVPVSVLVRRQALARAAPDWRGDVPDVCCESANGKPRWYRREVLSGADGLPYEVEVDGFDRRLRIPMPGAYQRFYLDPDPVPVVLARADYELWRAALDALVDDLKHELETVELMQSALAGRPWEEGDVPPIRLLPSLLPALAVDKPSAQSVREHYAGRRGA